MQVIIESMTPITLPNLPADSSTLLSFYRDSLQNDVLPFWLERTVDLDRGGIYTCLDQRSGAVLSEDKFVWSQARWVWVASHAARMVDRGVIDLPKDALLTHARSTADFLLEHAFLENGAVAYLLTGDGAKKEFLPGKGHDLSFYGDGFVVLGLSALARALNDAAYLERAITSYASIRERLASGNVRSEPYPLPPRHRAHGWPMIMLNVAQELSRAAQAMGDPRAPQFAAHADAYMMDVMDHFVRADLLVSEVTSEDGASSLLTRHVTPGHAIESMWFVIEQALTTGHDAYAERARHVMSASLQAGWDETHGGIFRYIDPTESDKRPRGEPNGPFEALILDTWDTKIWWPHSEALYATLLSDRLAPGEHAEEHDRVFSYAYATFPNPDRTIGEWVQIHDRQGRAIDKVVGLPVKDPYHLSRNLLLIVELLAEGIERRTTDA